MFVGNINRKVTIEDGKNLASDFGLKYYETSALNDMNVNEVFESLTREIIRIKSGDNRDNKESKNYNQQLINNK